MDNSVRVSAQRLFDKITREDKQAAVTIGIGKSAQGNPVLIPYMRNMDVPIPEYFDGYSVIVAQADSAQKVN